MLVKAKKWAEEHFEEGSRPSHATLLNWVKAGHLDGQIIGGLLFIDKDALLKHYAKSVIPQQKDTLIAGKFRLAQRTP